MSRVANRVSDIVHDKENIQPRREGRKFSQLKKGLNANPAEIQAQKLEWERKLQAGTPGNLLKLWEEYIRWTGDTFPRRSNETKELIQRCIHDLKGVEEYKQDLRFVRIWVMYADYMEDPIDLFHFLKINEIGLKYALYYEAFAHFLEQKGNYAKAEQVFDEGIAAKATPLTRLTRHKKDFQERALAHSLKLAQSGGNEEAGEKRSALSSIERSSTGERRRNGLADTRGGLTLAGKRPIEGQQASEDILEVYESGDEEEGDKVVDTTSAFRDIEELKFYWKDLPSEKEANKENRMKATQWTGQKLKQRKSASSSNKATAEFNIYTDAEEDTSAKDNKKRKERSRAAGSTQKSDEETSKKRKEANGYDESLLVNEDGEEMCFEMARATQFAEKYNYRVGGEEDEEEDEDGSALMDLDENSEESNYSGLDDLVNTSFNEDGDGRETLSEEAPTASSSSSLLVSAKVSTPSTGRSFGNVVRDNSSSLSRRKSLMISEEYNFDSSTFSPIVSQSSGNTTTDKWKSLREDLENGIGGDGDLTVPFGPRASTLLSPSASPGHTATFHGMSRKEEDQTEGLTAALGASGKGYGDPTVTVDYNTTAISKNGCMTDEPIESFRNKEGGVDCWSGDDFLDDACGSNGVDDLSANISGLCVDDAGGNSDFQIYADPTNEISKELLRKKYKSRASLASSSSLKFLPNCGKLLELDVFEDDDTDADVSLLGDYCKDSDFALGGSLNIATYELYTGDYFCQMSVKAMEALYSLSNETKAVFHDCRKQAAPNLRSLKQCQRDQTIDFRKSITMNLSDQLCLNDDKDRYIVNSVLGMVSSTCLFLVEKMEGDGPEPTCNLLNAEEFEKNQRALKWEQQGNPWEYYVCARLLNKIQNEHDRRHFVRFEKFYLYADHCFGVMPKEYTTLQRVVKCHSEDKTRTVPENMVVFYTIELLRALELCHSCEIIHGDVNLNNILIRSSNSRELTPYSTEKSSPWVGNGIQLSEFSKSIDTTMFPPGTKFTSSNPAEGSRQCLEIQLGLPWAYHVDTFGICNVLWTMLTGESAVVQVVHGKAMIAGEMPVGKAKEVLDVVLERLLNIGDEGYTGASSALVLRECREILEMYLKEDAKRSRDLKMKWLKQKSLLNARV